MKNELEDLEKISIQDENGVMKEATIFLSLTLHSSGKDYLIYSFENDEKEKDTFRIAQSQTEKDGKIHLTKVDSEEDLKQLEQIIIDVQEGKKLDEGVM